MIKNLIIEFTPTIIVAIIVIFSIIKVSIISVGLQKDYFSLFLNSFMFYNKVTIKNTFHERLKQFYIRSNKVNTIFYGIIAVVVLVYVLMKSL